MKKSILSALSIILLVSCNEKKSENNLHLSGNIKGLNQGTLYIQRLKDTKLVAIDSIKIDGDSHFEADIEMKSPEMLYLFLDKGVTNSIDNNLPFFAEAGNMNIDTNLEYFFNNAKITGSKNQELYQQYKLTTKGFNDQLLSLTADRLRAIKFKNSAELARVDNLEKNVQKRKYLYAANFALNNAKYEVSPFIALSEISDINPTYLNQIEKAMSPKVKESLYGQKLTEYCKELSKS